MARLADAGRAGRGYLLRFGEAQSTVSSGHGLVLFYDLRHKLLTSVSC